MAYITVTNIQAGQNPSAIYVTFQVNSSGNTATTAEAYLDDSATPTAMRNAIAESAREACRQNSEDIATDATVTIFGTIVQVS